ncbi:MAG: GNAT family N-acetyltransferase [Planctomycetes bacterium]|nr:GNAT family N-acetyltransferase [Planctomycetota bacterium]
MSPEAAIAVRAAGPEDLRHADAISEAIRREVEGGAIGMALRPPELIREKMLSGDAAIALSGDRWAGFCYISPWEGGRFVSTSALIVEPSFRGRGVARLLKRESLRLARERHPAARPFGLTTSPAVAKVNLELGFREVSYREITRDPGFWKGCESCPLHATLTANRGESCHCKAFVL